MTQQPNNPYIPDIIEPAFWKSKKFIAAMVHHMVVWGGVIFGGVVEPHSLTMTIPAAILSSTTVTAGQNITQGKVDQAQAWSPVYPSNGRYPPTQPPSSGAPTIK